MSIKRIFSQALLGLALSALLSAGLAFAAIDDYTISGDDIGVLPDAGKTSVLLASSAITLTDAGGDDFTNDPEVLTFTINTTDYPSTSFDTTVTSATIAGDCGFNTQDSLVYSASDTVATLTVSGGTSCTAGQTITIADLKVKTSYAVNTTSSKSIFTVDNTTTSAGGAVSSATKSLDVEEGLISSTNVEPGELTSLETTTNTISFTTAAGMPNLAKIFITYPSGFDVSGANGKTAGSLSGLDGTWTASVSGQVITFTQTGGSATAAGAISFTISSITNPEAEGSTGVYSFYSEIAAGNRIEQELSVSADTIVSISKTSAPVVGDVSGLSISGNADGVVLTWSDPIGDESDQIQILRGVDTPVSGTTYGLVDKGTQTFTDTDVAEGDMITYQIRAINGNEYGTLSSEVEITVAASGVEPEPVTEPTPEDPTNGGDTETPVEEPTTDPVVEVEPIVFSDTDGHWGSTEIQFMADAGIVEGNPDGTFLPDTSLDRAQAAVLIHRILGLGEPSVPTENPFIDVPKGAWYAGYIADLKAEASVEGNPDGTFEPAEFINRAEFLEMAMNAYKNTHSVDTVVVTDTYADLITNEWYAQTVSQATSLGFIDGNSCEEGRCFYADNFTTRAEATAILYRMFSSEL